MNSIILRFIFPLLFFLHSLLPLLDADHITSPCWGRPALRSVVVLSDTARARVSAMFRDDAYQALNAKYHKALRISSVVFALVEASFLLCTKWGWLEIVLASRVISGCVFDRPTFSKLRKEALDIACDYGVCYRGGDLHSPKHIDFLNTLGVTIPYDYANSLVPLCEEDVQYWISLTYFSEDTLAIHHRAEQEAPRENTNWDKDSSARKLLYVLLCRLYEDRHRYQFFFDTTITQVYNDFYMPEEMKYFVPAAAPCEPPYTTAISQAHADSLAPKDTESFVPSITPYESLASAVLSSDSDGAYRAALESYLAERRAFYDAERNK